MTTDPVGEFVPEWTDGDKLRKVRRHLRLSQEEFAERLQVNASTYMAWEADRNRVKDMRVIARRVKAMSGTPLWWWFDTERPSDPDGGGPDPGLGKTVG
ncbi:helix-turn-helix transcriptional regulator [Mycobacterium sp.]|uniref:helix-turn-helix domain-containing protein n=1 Tax=Mycobacterium sp. TaxID=1785 RepID=UPI0025EE3A0D|nr:helix-turn-helix transcriptional regulator [Mycobacterium sp.]